MAASTACQAWTALLGSLFLLTLLVDRSAAADTTQPSTTTTAAGAAAVPSSLSPVEEIIRHGLALWREYCDSRSVNATFALQVNRCALTAVALNEKLLPDCVKKHLPATDNVSSLQRLHQAQCVDPKDEGNAALKLNEVRPVFSGRKSAFDTCF